MHNPVFWILTGIGVLGILILRVRIIYSLITKGEFWLYECELDGKINYYSLIFTGVFSFIFCVLPPFSILILVPNVAGLIRDILGYNENN
jgi:hypothetical protein